MPPRPTPQAIIKLVFSARTAWPLAPNRLHQLAVSGRVLGMFFDLTLSNPTRCGFEYPEAVLLSALAQPASLTYDPQPLGLIAARQAVAGYYAGRGVETSPDHVLLTASTSEAYAHLFRLLCDPGDAVLMPAPSYPLFDMLARLHDVELIPVQMSYDDAWRISSDAVAAAATPSTRALLLVHPNNPTGSYIKPSEWDALQALAAERAWAVVVDEVFYDFAIPPAAPIALDLRRPPALTFVLNGLSKLAALPQFKLAWIGVFGPEPERAQALARLEVVNDLFLSAAAPAQNAAATALAARHVLQDQIQARLQINLAALDAALAALPEVQRLRLEGGWSVMLRLPRIHTDAAWAELLVERAGVLTHPGHFYGMANESHLAISLLAQPSEFAGAIARLCSAITAELA